MTTKLCRKCNTTKTITEFYKDRTSKDGLHSLCKQCKNTLSKIYMQKNKKVKNKYNKIHYETRKEKGYKQDKEYYKEYYQKNKKRISERKKKYHIDNKERMELKQKIYKKTESAKISIKNTRMKRRTITKTGDVTTQQLQELYENSKFCYWCNTNLKNKKIHLDHYIPLSKGGEHTLSNLVVSCPHCNHTKSNKDPYAFANSLGRLI